MVSHRWENETGKFDTKRLDEGERYRGYNSSTPKILRILLKLPDKATPDDREKAREETKLRCLPTVVI